MMLDDPSLALVREVLFAPAPAKIPIEIIDYKTIYAYKFSLDDFNALPETTKADFAEWLIARSKLATQMTGIPVNIEWGE